MLRVIVISGASSGLGKAMAELFAASGDKVYDLSRSGQNCANIIHIDCDLTQPAQIQAAFAQIGVDNGHIDLLINNAGMGVSGATEYISEEEARALMDVDFFAAWFCTKAALPWLRAARGAKIINISSVAAVFAIPFQSFYSAAKAATNALTEALAIELKPWHIGVTALMPGDVKSGFTAARVKNFAGEDIYGKAMKKSLAVMERDETTGMSPETIAAKVYQLAGKRRLKPLYTCGVKYKFFLFLGKILPCAVISRIIGAMYAPKE